MQEAKFRAWLEGQGYNAGTVSTQIARLKRIEAHYGPLSEKVQNGSLSELEATFTYSTQDERDGKPSPVELPIDGDLRTSLASYKSTIAYFRQFAESENVGGGANAPPSEISRDAVLATMAECDRLGLDSFLKRYEFGRPRDYWVVGPENFRLYPAKATVGVAHGQLPGGSPLSAAEFYGGFGEQAANTTLRELGFVVVDWPELQRARDSFLRQMPGFTSFRETEGAYWDIERRYKNKLINDVRAIADGSDDDRAAGEGIYRLLVSGQQGVPLNWRTLPDVQQADAALTDRFFTALGELARSEAPGEVAIAAAAHELEALRDAGIQSLKRGEVLSIPITVWATLHPEEASWFKIAKIEEMGKRFFGRKLFPQNDFRKADLAEWLQLMRALSGLLDKEFGWEPQDLFDVQGFVWVALGGNEKAGGDAATELDQGPYWFLGAAFGGTDHQLERFLAEGIWEISEPSDSHRAQVLSMKPGQRVAIKSTYVRKQGLPFDNRGKPVSVMAIKATGTITANPGDGERIEVEWDEPFEPREWYHFTYQPTVWVDLYRFRAGHLRV